MSLPILRRPLLRCVLLLAAFALILATRGGAQAAPPPFARVAPGVEVCPPPGELIESGQPIVVRLSAELALPAAAPAQAWIDAAPASMIRSGSQISLSLPAGLAGGLHQARLVIPALVGKPREVSWSIQVPAPVEGELRDASVTVTTPNRRTLYEGDPLSVTVSGPAGGKATAAAGNFSFALTETSPGQYSGSRDIARSDITRAEPVRVRITLPDGRVVGNRSDTDVKVLGRLFTIRIESPATGAKVPFSFVIRGRTRPNSTISISPSIGVSASPAQQSASANLRPSTIQRVQTTSMGGWDVMADANGRFEQKFGFPLRVVDISYTFYITARDPQGEQAIPRTLFVTLTTKKPSPAPEASPSPQPTP